MNKKYKAQDQNITNTYAEDSLLYNMEITSMISKKIAKEIISQIRTQSSCELKLKKAIKEAIYILEDTKKSFKSKTLEKLRKKLIQVLLETS